MAVADANYKFIFVDIGDYGRQCDSAVFSNTAFSRRLEAGQLGLPDPRMMGNFALLMYLLATKLFH
eukprot:m.49586 g.49586  ORF g.49586 m.49586 type:complete len:66 (+) comp34017_c0_seq1:297-494(+)